MFVLSCSPKLLPCMKGRVLRAATTNAEKGPEEWLPEVKPAHLWFQHCSCALTQTFRQFNWYVTKHGSYSNKLRNIPIEVPEGLCWSTAALLKPKVCRFVCVTDLMACFAAGNVAVKETRGRGAFMWGARLQDSQYSTTEADITAGKSDDITPGSSLVRMLSLCSC